MFNTRVPIALNHLNELSFQELLCILCINSKELSCHHSILYLHSKFFLKIKTHKIRPNYSGFRSIVWIGVHVFFVLLETWS